MYLKTHTRNCNPKVEINNQAIGSQQILKSQNKNKEIVSFHKEEVVLYLINVSTNSHKSKTYFS